MVVPMLTGLACGLGEPTAPSGPESRAPSGPARPPPEGAPRDLNWRDPTFGPYYRSSQGCYLQLPFDEPPTAVVPPPTAAVPCPPAMLAPAWEACQGGLLHQSAPGDCECRVLGNPPPPPRPVRCPGKVKQ